VVLIVETTAGQAVVLNRLRVIIDSRGPSVFIPPDNSHAPLPLRKFLIDLDQDVPEPVPEGPARHRASLMDAYHVGTPDFPYTVSPHDPENFEVMAYTDRSDVQWRLALDWTCRGKTGTVIIDNNGQPFRVAQPPPRASEAESAR
jgi:hypothetical protein